MTRILLPESWYITCPPRRVLRTWYNLANLECPTTWQKVKPNLLIYLTTKSYLMSLGASLKIIFYYMTRPVSWL